MTKPKTLASQLTLSVRRLNGLHNDAFDMLQELARIAEHHDSARLSFAIGHLATAREHLASALTDLDQAALVARTTRQE